MTKKELIDHLQHLEQYTHYSEDAPALRETIAMLKCSEVPNSSDTISRQEAIDLFPNDALEWDTKGGYIAPHLARRMIEELPSAQPEIVRCHKCIHWDRDTIRQNSNDAGWWNEAICERHSDENWTSWKDADWSCADAERRPDAETEV